MPPDEAEHLAAEVFKLLEALETLNDLLEEYAPLWYTEEHRDKAEAALRGEGSPQCFPFAALAGRKGQVQ